MNIEDVINRVSKKLEAKKSLSDGFDMFERKGILSKELVRLMAEENLFAPETVTGFLNKHRKSHYHFKNNYINNYKKVKKKGVSINDFKRIDILGIARVYYTEQGVKALLKHYHEKNCINNYKGKNVLKDLKETALVG